MKAYIRDRDANDIILPTSLRVRPIRYRSDAQGGHIFATLRIDGDALALWRLMNWLRYRVEIHDELATPVWWGYVHSVSLNAGGVGMGISLDSMANKVACIWSSDTDGAITTYAEDINSSGIYGTKELLISASGVNETAAEQRRDWELARRKYPSPIITARPSDIQYAEIECRGWIETLTWTYYERDEGLTEYVPANGVAQKMGWGFSSTELGFTARNRTVSEGTAYFNELVKGDKFRVASSSSNNSTFTVESSSDREPDSVTDTSIAFLQQERRASNEYLRASHDVERKLNNANLYGATTTLGTTTAASGITGAHDGSNDAAVLADSGESWTTDEWAERKIINVTDGSTGTVKSNTSNTLTVNLSGGQDDDWDTGDTYIISYDEIWLSDTSVVQNGDRIRIELDAGGYFETFVRGTPDNATGRVLVEGNIPSLVSSGNDVIRVNRWVTNESGDTFYAETTDYSIGATDGTITVDSGGSITNNSVMKVSYIYTEYRIEDANLGLAFVNANDMIEVSGSSGGTNDGWYRVLSTGFEGDRVTVKESVANEGPGSSITIARGGNVTIEESLTDELPGASATVYGYATQIAQSFQIDSDAAWNLYTAEIKARRIGTPSDNLTVAIYNDSSGSPGSAIETATVVGSSVGTQTAWVSFTFAGTTTLSASTTYWIVVNRSSSQSPVNYFEVTIDEDQQYSGGALKVRDGASWLSRPSGGDMPFRLLGSEETTTQISTLITQESEFITATDIIDTSGVFINQYRDGRNTSYDELMELLEIGTTNDVRLLATVTRGLRLHVEEEPAQPIDADYILTTDGTVRTKLGQLLRLGHLDFVGQWLEIADLPPTADFTYINAPSPFLVESAEYDVERMEYTITPRGAEPVWRAGMSIDEG